jgi:hypothetical protein
MSPPQLGNEKNVTRKGGDADSDLERSESGDQKQTDSDKESDREETKATIDVIKISSKKPVNKRTLRRQVAAKAHSAVVLPVDVATGDNRDDLEGQDSNLYSTSRAGGAASGQDVTNFDEVDGPYSANVSGGLDISTAGHSMADSGFFPPATIGASVTSPSIVGPLFSPDSLNAPGGLSRSPAKRSKLGRPKIAVAKDPKWHY